MEEPVRRCPYCGSELRLVNVIERFGERPKVRILQCTSGNEPQFSANGGEDSRWEGRNLAAPAVKREAEESGGEGGDT
jgi:hypothetical protein